MTKSNVTTQSPERPLNAGGLPQRGNHHLVEQTLPGVGNDHLVELPALRGVALVQSASKTEARKSNLLMKGVSAVVCAIRLAWLQRSETVRFRDTGDTVRLANIAEGQHPSGNIRKLLDGAFPERYVLVKLGSDSNHVTQCGPADTPIGICTDEGAAAEEEVNIALLGRSTGTGLMVAVGAIAAGALLEPAAGGRVSTLAGGAGTHHVVGRALTAAAAAGDVIEVDTMYFLRVI